MDRMSDERTFEVPADPADRRRVRRSTVRVLVLDDRERVLLLGDSDPGTGARWWITPGGGIEPGESELDAVVRELAEETGLQVAGADVLGPLARRWVWHGYSDQVVEQHDTFYAIRVPTFTVDLSGITDEEQVTLHGVHWWTGAELAATEETVWPAELAEIWSLVERPGEWPRELATVEESSVPCETR